MSCIARGAGVRPAGLALREAPWRIFAAGYLPTDAGLAKRLDWLVSQYLLQEDLEAAEALTELQREILAAHSD